MDCYAMTRQDLLAQKRYPIAIVPNSDALSRRCARVLADLILQNDRAGKPSTVILPVGPLDFRPFADLCNQEKVPLANLFIYMMDEYLDERDRPIPESHPLSFARFVRENLVNRLDSSLGFASKNLHSPLPDKLKAISETLLGMGGADLCFAGMGLTGHLAFNDPPEPGETDDPLNWLRQCRARKLTISRESVAQMVMGGAHGNWAIVPKRACTLGLKELLATKHIHLTFMRVWHSGVLRRAMFGPISADCPGSLVQEHPSVEATIAEIAAAPPLLNVAQDTGE
ncbi:MAG: hypothetical protein NTW86_15015 [Candidatus Sumerlaeota bacterium]|nr:hypothetical protein [Candidatus Sumerlaeota bacterium]